MGDPCAPQGRVLGTPFLVLVSSSCLCTYVCHTRPECAVWFACHCGRSSAHTCEMAMLCHLPCVLAGWFCRPGTQYCTSGAQQLSSGGWQRLDTL